MLNNMTDSYYSIVSSSEGIFKDRGSKFLAFAYPVEDEEDVKKHIEQLKKKFYDATHHCYAYQLGMGGVKYRANDDGEPNHSAGDPILGQIRSREISDVLVVVVRYFGGTKLGVPGLINAYKSAAAAALEKVDRIEKFITKDVTLEYNYPEMNVVMKMVKDLDLQIVHQELTMNCKTTVRVRLSKLGDVKKMLERQPNIVIKEC